MNTTAYYKHCRTLGAFTAQDCLDLARQAAELDRQAAAKKTAPHSEVWNETMPDGGNHLRLSHGVKCF